MRLLYQAKPAPKPGERSLMRLSFAPDTAELVEVENLKEATHQIVNALGRPFLTHLSERDQVVSAEMQRAGHWDWVNPCSWPE